MLEGQGSSLVWCDDDRILIPYSTAERMTGQTGATTFYAKSTNEDAVSAAISSVGTFLL